MNLQAILDPILKPITEALLTITPLLLNLLYALVLLLIGLLIAKGLEWAVVTILEAIQLNKWCKEIDFTTLLAKGDIKRGPTELVGSFIYWLTIFVAVTAIAKALGLVSAKVLLAGLLGYLPSVLSAAYILGVGIFAAILLSAVVLIIANNIDLSNANTLAKIVQYAIIIFAALAALGQLGISVNWIITSITLVVGGITLAFAIAFGLGAQGMAADFLKKFFK